jgi:ATP-dependent RNA helicase DeaD
MLDIGFLPDVERILGATPRERQTALLSATLPAPIRRVVRRYMRDPAWVQVGGEIETVPAVHQVYYEVWEADRPHALLEILDTSVNGGKVLLFRRTQVGVDRLVRGLQSERVTVAGIHGGMNQSQRNAVMNAFRSGELRVLVATNVAARGLDIPEVSHVVNYDMPDNVEEYVHRIGRTARMGRDGTAITLVTEWTFEMLDALQGHLGDALQRGELAFYEHGDRR